MSKYSFYKSNAWKQKRKEILIRDNYECQRCKAQGKYTKATVVHHKKHYQEHKELGLVDSNLISLCDICHNLEHPEKLGKVNEKKKKEIHQERWE